MKTGQYLALAALLLWASTADAQRVRGGAGFVKVGIANAPGAGRVFDQIAPTLGLRAGYHISQQSSSWRNDVNDRLPNLPAYTNKGYYVTLAIGGGRFVKK